MSQTRAFREGRAPAAGGDALALLEFAAGTGAVFLHLAHACRRIAPHTRSNVWMNHPEGCKGLLNAQHL